MSSAEGVPVLVCHLPLDRLQSQVNASVAVTSQEDAQGVSDEERALNLELCAKIAECGSQVVISHNPIHCEAEQFVFVCLCLCVCVCARVCVCVC